MSMVLYGIPALDKALYGINIVSGELILIRGQQKRRKTTLFLNILANIYSAPIPLEKPTSVIDVLESGMTPERYRDSLLSIVASKILMEQGHTPNTCGVCEGFCRELKLSPDYLRFHNRTKAQAEAIEQADAKMSEWPIFIFGAHEEEGNTRDLDEALLGSIKASSKAWHVQYGQHYDLAPIKELRELSRWEFLRQYTGAKIFAVDHIQQYDFDRDYSDYEKQQRVISKTSAFVAQKHTVMFAISQVSLTSVRDARQGSGRAYEAGGTKASAEANVIMSPQYSFDDRGVMYIVLEESRRAPSFTVECGIEAVSGAFYGDQRIEYKRKFISD